MHEKLIISGTSIIRIILFIQLYQYIVSNDNDPTSCTCLTDEGIKGNIEIISVFGPGQMICDGVQYPRKCKTEEHLDSLDLKSIVSPKLGGFNPSSIDISWKIMGKCNKFKVTIKPSNDNLNFCFLVEFKFPKNGTKRFGKKADCRCNFKKLLSDTPEFYTTLKVEKKKDRSRFEYMVKNPLYPEIKAKTGNIKFAKPEMDYLDGTTKLVVGLNEARCNTNNKTYTVKLINSKTGYTDVKKSSHSPYFVEFSNISGGSYNIEASCNIVNPNPSDKDRDRESLILLVVLIVSGFALVICVSGAFACYCIWLKNNKKRKKRILSDVSVADIAIELNSSNSSSDELNSSNSSSDDESAGDN